jgi:PAS domain S-box-containing protein
VQCRTDVSGAPAYRDVAIVKHGIPNSFQKADRMQSQQGWSAEQAAAFSRLMLGETQQYGVLFYDADLRITGWNHGASFLTGWTAEEVLGRPTAMLFVPEDRARKLDVHEANTARVVGVAEDERWHMRKDGSCLWSSGVSLVLAREHGEPTGYMKVFRDATHMRTRLKYLENVNQAYVADQQDKNVFIGKIAHEMRNPLSPLKTAVELFKKVVKDNPGHARVIKVMERQIGFLDRLVEDLLDLTRVKTGRMHLAYEPVILQDFLLEILESTQPAAAAKEITVRHVMPPLPIDIDIDRQRLQQVIVNLLNNAIKYTQRGGHVWMTATLDQTHFVCYLKDDGQGIGPGLLPKIFDIFTQASDRQAHRGDGLGIGLTVVKEIVTLHQGTIEVRSEGPGLGSEFTVRIPQRRPHGAEPEPLPPPPPPPAPDAGPDT